MEIDSEKQHLCVLETLTSHNSSSTGKAIALLQEVHVVHKHAADVGPHAFGKPYHLSQASISGAESLLRHLHNRGAASDYVR